jgi:hypothetical protein
MAHEPAAIPVSNSTVLCVGGITRRETELAQESGIDVDGRGYYLFLARVSEPRRPIHLLAKFFSQVEAGLIARLIAAQLA